MTVLTDLLLYATCNTHTDSSVSGCSKPLVARTIHASDYFGTDGFGDVPDPHAPSLDLVQKKKAEQAIIDFVNENPGEVILVAIAPLTNLAVTVQLDPTLSKKLKALFIMGGNTEYPEAAYIVLNRYTCPTYITTWEFTCRNSLPWSFCDTWFANHTEKSEFVRRISAISREVRVCKLDLTVELEGTYTRGMMALDYMHKLKKKHTVFIMNKVDLDMFQEMLINAIK
uniref:Inosine/uridine-preferring nucleoside hydrolase domain-containing protein n=1 Tax=Amphilophus citrinellus TaxID=61819 RepID=A0A3Q0RSS2_AMPCI